MANAVSTPYLAVLLRDRAAAASDGQYGLSTSYAIDFWVHNFDTGKFDHACTWRITLEYDSFVRMDLATHFGSLNSTNASLSYSASSFLRQTLITLHTDREFKAIQFSYDRLSDMVMTFADPWTKSESRRTLDDLTSTLYTVTSPAYRIRSAVLVTEGFRRIYTYRSTCNKMIDTEFADHTQRLAQTVYVAAVIDEVSSGNQTLVHQEVREFAALNMNATHGLQEPLNPANRTSTFNCTNGYEDPKRLGRCLPQYATPNITLPRGANVEEIQFRYIDKPSNKNDKSSICKLVAAESDRDKDYDDCMEEMKKLHCDLEVYKKYDAVMMRHQYYQQLFLHDPSNRTTWIYGSQFTSDSEPSKLFVTFFNRVSWVGRMLQMEIAPNGHHVMAVLQRRRFEINSLERFNDICDKLKDDPDNIFLQRYKKTCDDHAPRRLNFNDFGQAADFCLPGLFCPGVNISIVDEKVDEGKYTLRPHVKITCEKGNFCSRGQRVECPQGAICGTTGMSAPERCMDLTEDKTCADRGLEKPKHCPDGTLCTTPYYPPIASPPGYYQSFEDGPHGRGHRSLYPCREGDYCALGRYADNTTLDGLHDLLCPGKTACNASDVMEPKTCNCTMDYCSYCPNGTVFEQPCPAGAYCSAPDEIANCTVSDYCKNGSFISEACPAGYFCPTPAIKEQCPAGYYCKVGSARPHPCPWLSYCPRGSDRDPTNTIGFLGMAAIIVLVYAFYLVVVLTRYAMRKALYATFRSQAEMEASMDAASDETDETEESEESDSTVTSPTGASSGALLLSQNRPQHQGRRKRQQSALRAVILGRYDRTYTRMQTYFCDLAFDSLGLKLKSGKQVLHNVTGEFKHGTLTCVLGGSGSGKTTFMTTLAGRAYYGTQLGQIYVNGKPDSLTQYNRLVGFVPQEDIMIRQMTVEESLTFAARTKGPKSRPLRETVSLVDRIIRELGLDDVRHSLIGDERKRGISGGQRKRVNIGLELVAEPCVLFLDEPTSGLDSTASMEVVKILRNISEKGITVVTVIHQPRFEVFELFTHALVLAKGGHCVFQGTTHEAVPYFEALGYNFPEHVNAADYILDIVQGDVPNERFPEGAQSGLIDEFEQYSAERGLHERVYRYRQNVKPRTFRGLFGSVTPEFASPTSPASALEDEPDDDKLRAYRLRKELRLRSTSAVDQWYNCFKRSIIQQLRDLGGFFIDLSLVFVAGLALGSIFFDSEYVGPLPKSISDLCKGPLRELCELPRADPILSQTFFSILAVALAGTMSALKSFGPEKVVFARESTAGLSTSAYFVTKDLSNLPRVVLSPIVFLIIFSFLSSPRSNFFVYYGVLALVYFTGYGAGYVLSIVFEQGSAQLGGVVFTLILAMFSGSNPTLKKLQDMYYPVPIFPYLSYLRWAQEALYLVELNTYASVFNIDKSLRDIGYNMSNLWIDIGVLVLYAVLFRCVAFVALKAQKDTSYLSRLLRLVGDINQYLSKQASAAVHALLRRIRRRTRRAHKHHHHHDDDGQHKKRVRFQQDARLLSSSSVAGEDDQEEDQTAAAATQRRGDADDDDDTALVLNAETIRATASYGSTSVTLPSSFGSTSSGPHRREGASSPPLPE